MDKTTLIFNLATWAAQLLMQELAERREREGKSDVEILADAGHQVDENDLLALQTLAKYRAAEQLPTPPDAG